MAGIPPKQVNLDGGANNKEYVVGNPINVQLNQSITFSANDSAFSVVIDGNDGFFNPSQIWDEFIAAGESKTTPEIKGSMSAKLYSVFCINNNDYHGEKMGVNNTDSPPKIIIIS